MKRRTGLLAFTLLLVLAAARCESSDGDGFQPVDAEDTASGVDAVAGVDSVDVVKPPLGEPEWRLVSKTELDPGEETWRAVHGATLAGDEWVASAVGTNGTVAIYDSASDAWTFRNIGEARTLQGVWVEDRDTILVIGDEGVARRWDPSLSGTGDWLLAEILGYEYDLLDVWGDAADGQWVCGDRGIVARWDAESVTPRWDVKLFPNNETTDGTKLEAIWGTSQAEIWAVGGKLVIKWDGAEWQRYDVDVRVHDVWGERDGPVYVAADGGTILSFDRAGNAFVPMTPGLPLAYWSVHGIDADHVWAGALNSAIARTTGNGWELEFIEEKPGSPADMAIPRDLRFVDIWGNSVDNLIFVSNSASIVRRSRFALP